jgi:hypothetical protein
MTRAVARALHKAWDADIDPAEIEGERVHDLVLIEQRMKARLPSAAMTRRDLRNAALARSDHGQRLGQTSLTLGNIGGSHTSGNNSAKIALAGWAARIRTWEWRNQNPEKDIKYV